MLALSTISLPSRAEVPARALVEALSRAGSQSLGQPKTLALSSPEPLGVLVESSESLGAPFTHVTGNLYYVRQSVTELERTLKRYPRAHGFWAPPLRPLLDRADEWVAAGEYRAQTGLSGESVVVGIVDTGFDVTHPDLRNADGSTRVAWMIDFSRAPLGLHPDLEETYGCTSENFECAIYGKQDLDSLLTNRVRGDEPKDRRGHGTHVASLAAGNGLSQTPARYVGIAPGATLAFAQVAGRQGAIEEAHVLAGTQFLFDRAREAGQPAVINISLGTDFGAHDGSSALERALSDLVADEPGRAIVVAAGNSGSQVVGLTDAYPGPFGVHTEVHVPEGSTARIPVLTISRDAPTQGGVFLWLEARPKDRLRLGFAPDADAPIQWADYGESRAFQIGGGQNDYQVTLFNGLADESLGLEPGSAAVVLLGTWPRGKTFGIYLEGHGSALMWVEGGGALLPGLGGGAFLPRSSKEGTISIPATSPDLIAVGATLNRQSWPQVADVALPSMPALDVPLDSVAYFSAAGPNSLGLLKPELVAPGANVIGALSRDADPRNTSTSVFASAPCSDPACVVVDDQHAVSTGSSMAAPIVAGAAALLLQRDPSLTGRELRGLLMAGSRAVTGNVVEQQQAGAGVLDLIGSLRALDLMASGAPTTQESPSNTKSRLVLASSFVRPDPSWPLTAKLLLRNEAGEVIDIETERLNVEVPGAEAVSLEREAPGLFDITLAARADAGGKTQKLRVLVDSKLLLERNVPVAVDRPVAHFGFSARGGCQLTPPAHERNDFPLLISALLLIAAGGRRAGSVLPARRATSRRFA